MLSRLARSSAARSLISSRPLAALPQLNRKFNSSTALKNSGAAPVTKEAPLVPGGPADIIDKYGATTFWGMVAAIMVSKEMFILDAEFLLSLEIGAFVMTGYVLTGDTLNKMSEEMDAKTAEKFNGANDFMIEMFSQYKMVNSTLQNKPAVMKQYQEEFKNAITEFAAYQTVEPQHAAREQILATLEQIKAKEDHAAAMEWQNTVDSAVANVKDAFAKGDAKLNEEMLDLAVKNMGFTKPETTEENDPVKRLFMAQF